MTPSIQKTLEEKLREEFNKYALREEIDDLSFHELLDETADWWLSKFKEYQSHLVSQLEGEKKIVKSEKEVREEMKKDFCATNIMKGFGFNEALDTAISIINKSME